MRALRLFAASVLAIGLVAVDHVADGPRAGAAPGIITTLAGNGTQGTTGNCPPATSAHLNHPRGIVHHPDGELYIADWANYRVRRLDDNGVSTAAGTGSNGAGGDGGPATSAFVSSPSDVAIDASGNLYIADSGNHRIRRVDRDTGIITAVAGTGVSGYSGDGGPATAADLGSPWDVAVGPDGDLYITERTNFRVRRVDAATGSITTVAGNGVNGYAGDGGPATAASVSHMNGVEVDADGNLYIADYGNRRVRRVDATTGTMTTIAGNGLEGSTGDGGPATAASLTRPSKLALGPSAAHLYIADFGSHQVRRVDLLTGTITTVAGVGSAGFSGDGGPATAAQFDRVDGVALDDDGNLLVTDGGNNRIRRVDTATGVVTTVAGDGTAADGGDCPLPSAVSLRFAEGVHVSDDEHHVFITDDTGNLVRRVGPSGTVGLVVGGGLGFAGDGGPAIDAKLFAASDLTTDHEGNLYIADTGNQRIRRVDAATGTISTVAGNGGIGYSGDGGPATAAGLHDPYGVAVQGDDLYIADTNSNRIRRVDLTSGTITTVAGDGVAGFSGDGGPATAARFNGPVDLAIDEAGDLYVVDRGNLRVRRIDADTGVISTAAGTVGTTDPGEGGPASEAFLGGIRAVDTGPGGRLYLTQDAADRVRMVDTDGLIYTIAGEGSTGFSGDGGPAIDATLNNPAGIAVTSTGDVIVSDLFNQRIRRIDGPVPPTLGYLRVTTAPALPATITVDGVPRDSWGLNWVPLPPGPHEVCFGAVPGFTTPPCEPILVAAGETTEVVGDFAPRGFLRVTTTPALPATITVDGVPRNDWGVWTDVEPGDYEVCFGAVAGRATPPCQIATVTPGATTTVNGTYPSSPGAPGPAPTGFLRVTTDPAVPSRISIDGHWRDSWGLTWLKVPLGTYDVCFEPVLYADPPTCALVGVAVGATTTVVGGFSPHGFLRVLTDPALAATVLVDGARANAWGVWTSKPPGTYTVCFSTVPGWPLVPPCEEAVVEPGVTTTVTGTYEAN